MNIIEMKFIEITRDRDLKLILKYKDKISDIDIYFKGVLNCITTNFPLGFFELINKVDDYLIQNNDLLLEEACRVGNKEIINFLLDKGCYVSSNGWKPLSNAVSSGNIEIIKQLSTYCQLSQVLEFACDFQNKQIIDFFIKQDDYSLELVLNRVVMKRSFRLIKWLLSEYRINNNILSKYQEEIIKNASSDDRKELLSLMI